MSQLSILITMLCLGQAPGDESSLKALQQRVETTQISLSKEAGRKAKLVEKPVFHYSDELRQIEDAGVWLTTSCGRDWSDWCRSRLFLPTVHQMLGYEVGLTSGGRVRSRLVDAEPKTAVGGQRPEARTAELSDSDALTSAAIPGVEQFERFAEIINTSPRVSDTDRCSRQEFEDRFAVKFVEEVGATVSQSGLLGNVELQQDELWHWVGGVLLGVMLLEGFVGNRTTA